MSQQDDLKMIQKIRSLRVSKYRKNVQQVQSAIATLKQEINDVNEKIQAGQQSFAQEKKAIIEELMGKRTDVDPLLTLQKKELLARKQRGDALKQRSAKEEDVLDKGLVHKAKLKELWELEKALIKIEEMVKMELS